MTKYFARIDGEQRGPFTLEELPGAGVTPDTYVWCKGMEDWEKACHEAEICRYFRQRLAGVHSATDSQPASERNGKPQIIELEARNLQEAFQQVTRIVAEQQEEAKKERLNHKPRVSLGLSVAAMLLCFPPTGLAGIYYGVRANKEWKSAEEAEKNLDIELRDALRRASHESARKATMWTGITFFMGLIMWAAIARFSDSM